ncbi:MAG: metalloregulator ArsR/SmtB family transcription factor [Dehalococcoidia bacterium]|nr:metalloregulator ArsR/SmtB family transcription factor [Dehalococcoidia bacterium]
MEDRIYLYHADMCKVFSHPKRLELINVLREGEMSVNDLSKRLCMEGSNLSQHLAMMRERRILVTRKEGNAVYYRIANPRLLTIFDMMRQMLFEQIESDAELVHNRTSKAQEVGTI